MFTVYTLDFQINQVASKPAKLFVLAISQEISNGLGGSMNEGHHRVSKTPYTAREGWGKITEGSHRTPKGLHMRKRWPTGGGKNRLAPEQAPPCSLETCTQLSGIMRGMHRGVKQYTP